MGSLLTVLAGPQLHLRGRRAEGTPSCIRRPGRLLLLLTTPTAVSPRSWDLRTEGKAEPASCPEPKQPHSLHRPDRDQAAQCDTGQAAGQGGSRGGTEEAFSLKTHGHQPLRDSS